MKRNLIIILLLVTSFISGCKNEDIFDSQNINQYIQIKTKIIEFECDSIQMQNKSLQQSISEGNIYLIHDYYFNRYKYLIYTDYIQLTYDEKVNMYYVYEYEISKQDDSAKTQYENIKKHYIDSFNNESEYRSEVFKIIGVKDDGFIDNTLVEVMADIYYMLQVPQYYADNYYEYETYPYPIKDGDLENYYNNNKNVIESDMKDYYTFLYKLNTEYIKFILTKVVK